MKDNHELPRLSDSISYLYIEHAIIEQDNLSIVAIQEDGKIPIPVAATTCLMLGPGTKVTHAAIRTLSENGCMVIWCGEGVGRFYASGIGETRSAKNLLAQAQCCMDKEKHLEVARKMYILRFPGIKTDGFSIQQLRGMEGIRVRKTYEQYSRTAGIAWKKRSYKSDNWSASDPINQALSEANSMLYGICHAAIVSLGYSPGLGFIHTGKQLSFVYDVADLYKTETSIPAAFEAVKHVDIHKSVRQLSRQYFASSQILKRIPNDLASLFQIGDVDNNPNYEEPGQLWDEDDSVSGGINYGEVEL